MNVDFLLIGQGVCGTFLSWELEKAGYSFLVIDEVNPNAASRIAAGIINPVTGRRLVKTWLIDEVMPFALESYNQLESLLAVSLIEQKNSLDFFPTPQMKIAFEKRCAADASYLSLTNQPDQWRHLLNYDFDYGIIEPCYLVNLPALLPAYRERLWGRQQLWEETFRLSQLHVETTGIRYKDITAQYVIFCDGIAAFNNPHFTNLPFAPNKGEALWVEIENLPATHIYKKGINLVPWSEGIFWAGSSYEWAFENDQPTEAFRERTLAILQHWIKAPVKLLDHKASVRPATLERRPFVGFHPVHPAFGIFNGMGTKGCSLAPFFARQFTELIKNNTPLHPEADINRFKRILSVNKQ